MSYISPYSRALQHLSCLKIYHQQNCLHTCLPTKIYGREKIYFIDFFLFHFHWCFFQLLIPMMFCHSVISLFVIDIHWIYHSICSHGKWNTSLGLFLLPRNCCSSFKCKFFHNSWLVQNFTLHIRYL